MKYPNFNEEKKLQRRGYDFVVGLDEAGRGPLAGPVVAGAVIIKNLKSIFNDKVFKKINDSKKMTPKTREEVYDLLTKHPQIKWGIGIVSEKIIDKINILEATKLAMQKAIKDLFSPTKDKELNFGKIFVGRQKSHQNCFLLIDGNFTLRWAQGKTDILQKSIIKGDQKVISISAASIIAKVTRDKIMEKYDKKYPQYGFKKHKGYPTEFHRNKIKEFGLCRIHRKSFHLD